MSDFKYLKKYYNPSGQLTYECECEVCGGLCFYHKRTHSRIICPTCAEGLRVRDKAPSDYNKAIDDVIGILSEYGLQGIITKVEQLRM